ncbi:TlpA family protein disulfide reductase [Catenuloplanes atrovinosus]|uniref:Thiol-disulfide isomerase/thioredoxin n=1 Tax=Catenuloplanes atrovinosus TaxID=137266 RepID=A0AAE3YTT1_9ACTN|nr:TlpA disulfide reductase family protein [Catenuloplanes atrovinosus]MDR7279754.1 thiol-disulfide isomerase/thioredoxin [Catenuloplanes atrovinosus]
MAVLTRPRAIAAGVALLIAGAVAGGLVAGRGDWADACATGENGVIECAAGERPDAPAAAGELLDGTRYDLASARGNVVVVNFWGSWCSPCRAEAKELEQTYQATKASGVEFLGINNRDDRDAAIAFERGRVTYPSLFDPANRLGLDFDIPPGATPSTVILDREGRIAMVIRRSVLASELTPLVQRVAAEHG